MSKFLALFMFVGLATLLASGSASVDPAGAQCNPNRPNDLFPYHSGWQRYPGGTLVGGVYSEILNYDAYVAFTFFQEGTVTHVSLMASGFWAQVGWMDLSAGYSHRTYTQWVDSQGFTHTSHFTGPPEPQPVGTYGFYTALYNNYAPGYITFYSAGRLIQILPANIVGWAPNAASVFAITKSLASQMPGGYNAPQFMKSTDIWYDGSWKPFSGTMSVGAPSIHGGLPFGNRAVYVWDKACSI